MQYELTDQDVATIREALGFAERVIVRYHDPDKRDSDRIVRLDSVRQALALPQPAGGWVPLDAPDSPGWWAFEGAEREMHPVLPKKYESWEDYDNDWPDHRPDIKYQEGVGIPFRSVLEVKWVEPGQQICDRKHAGPHSGDPVLGFLSPKYRWSHALYGIDTLIGKWWRLTMPWDNQRTQQPAMPEPDWSNAPEWAQWWAVAADGLIQWSIGEPQIKRFGEWKITPDWNDSKFWGKAPEIINIPIGIDWRLLKCQRPPRAEGE